MSQRYNLFHAGYAANTPYLYCELNAIDKTVRENPVSDSITHINPAFLDQKKLQGENSLQNFINFSQQFGLSLPDLASIDSGYQDWRKHVNQSFEQLFPMTKIDHYYYMFGRRLAEVIGNTEICIELVGSCFATNVPHPIILNKCSKFLSDTEYLVFKMMAPAALLSGEYRHHHFSVFYKELSSLFKPMAGVEIKSLDKENLSALKQNLEAFLTTVLNGLTKSSELLKELGV